ncbi:hypothetical protein N0V94_003832 [Neodidymelliopsis sp. IMI 364377]|nr:hypothetical protein N0V94_003832 [Neodidymelliopsis sp. IMI 364377]
MKESKHGTYRPALLGLVKSNPADLIKSTTKEAFASLSTTDDVMKALKILTKLRGIGPATASLLLSVYQPDEVPFFSDELFRWTHWEEKGKTGWGRTIKYNVTEYKQVLVRIEELRGRLGARAVDAERVAYVLGNEAVDVEVEVEVEGSKDGEKNEGEAVGEKVEEDTESDENIVEAAAANTDEKKLSAVPSNDRVKKEGKTIEEKEESGKIVTKTGKTETSEGKGAKQSATKGTKRKAQEERTSTEGTRRSTRRRV